jgi:hypothetical protein
VSSVDPQVEALIRAGLKPQVQEQSVPQQALVTINTVDGPQKVPVPLAMVIILDNILDELQGIRAALNSSAENAQEQP